MPAQNKWFTKGGEQMEGNNLFLLAFVFGIQENKNPY